MSQTKAQLLDNIKDNVQLDAQKALRFADSDSSHYVAFRAPGTVSSSVTWTLPAADGSANYVLATDGSGTLSWIADPAGQWVTSGSNIYFTGGNVGIGDNSPSNPLSVTGASAFNGDVQFTGASYNVTWDKSADDLIFNDNAKAVFGTGSDLQVYYTGSAGWIYQSESGNDVSLGANGGNVWLRTGASANDDAIKCVNDGAVELYHDGTKKAETSSSGLTVTGNSTATSKFRGNDNVKLSLGDGEDIQIYHDGSNTYLHNNTGRLRLESDNLGVGFYKGAGSETLAMFNIDAECSLYYNNSKKIETQSDGVTVSGWVYIPDSDGSNNMVRLGNGADLQIYHNGSHSFIHQDGTGSLYILADTFRLNNEANTENIIAGNADGAVELYYDGSNKLQTESNGVRINGILKTSITSGQALTYGDNAQIHLGTGDDLQIYHDGSNSYVKDAGTGELRLESDAGGVRIQRANGNTGIFYNVGGQVELYYDNSKKLETANDKINFYADAKVNTDDTYDLGASGARWKDLYLSGGLFVGGTGAANEFDDYEEGDWEPVVSPENGSFTSITMHGDTGAYYTKYGRQVYVMGCVRWTDANVSGASGNLEISLPFTPSGRSNGDNCDDIGAVRVPVWNGNNRPTMINVRQGSANCWFGCGTMGNDSVASGNGDTGDNGMIQFSVSFRTAT